MSPLQLVIFDVDGTLVDSQGDILSSMAAAFGAQDLPVPARSDVLGIVGLSLPQAMARLAPDLAADRLDLLVETYKDAYADLRHRGGPEASPLYPGIRDLIDRLAVQDTPLLGIATGKSRRGLDALLDSHGLTQHFVTRQVADDHPSKPHPAMLYTALEETGVAAENAVMIGDTSFDMEMAEAAGIPAIGVTWGYHPGTALGAARVLVSDTPALETAIAEILGGTP